MQAGRAADQAPAAPVQGRSDGQVTPVMHLQPVNEALGPAHVLTRIHRSTGSLQGPPRAAGVGLLGRRLAIWSGGCAPSAGPGQAL